MKKAEIIKNGNVNFQNLDLKGKEFDFVTLNEIRTITGTFWLLDDVKKMQIVQQLGCYEVSDLDLNAYDQDKIWMERIVDKNKLGQLKELLGIKYYSGTPHTITKPKIQLQPELELDLFNWSDCLEGDLTRRDCMKIIDWINQQLTK